MVSNKLPGMGAGCGHHVVTMASLSTQQKKCIRPVVNTTTLSVAPKILFTPT